ncbi:MAG: YggU family protein [Chloroflexi bacterium]|nr:YggU family protein [Chloroflexota bacterium]
MAEKKATLEVHVQPGARKDEVVGLRDGVLWIRVKAPAIKGQANSALVAFVAQLLGVSKGDVVIARGRASRQKVVAIQGLSLGDLKEKLAQALPRK